MILKDKESFESLEEQVPYIIGQQTHLKFIKMTDFVDFMQLIDQDRDKVAANGNNEKFKVYQHYRKNWQRCLKKSRFDGTKPIERHDLMQHHVESVDSSIIQGKYGPNGNYPLGPYEVHNNRKKGKIFSEYDTIWCHPMLTRPGITDFIIVYKFGKGRYFKGTINSFVPMRNQYAVHHHIKPVLREEPTREKLIAQQDVYYYFSVFSNLKQRMAQKSLSAIIKRDF